MSDPSPHTTSVEGVLLDIDGTLLDTNTLHTVAWWRAFRSLGSTFPMASIHRLIGMGGDKLVPELAGRDIDGASDAWTSEFDQLLDQVTLLPGARELVESLHARDQVVVLATSAPEDLLDRFRDVLDIEAWIAGVTSSDDADASKPDPDIFEVAMERFGLAPATTVAVGDSVWDAKAAGRAGIRFIGVETGGTTRERLDDAGAVAVHADPAALAHEVRSLRTWW